MKLSNITDSACDADIQKLRRYVAQLECLSVFARGDLVVRYDGSIVEILDSTAGFTCHDAWVNEDVCFVVFPLG